MAAGFGPAKEPKRRVKMDEMVGGLGGKRGGGSVSFYRRFGGVQVQAKR